MYFLGSAPISFYGHLSFPTKGGFNKENGRTDFGIVLTKNSKKKNQ